METFKKHFKGNEKGAAIIYRYLGVLVALSLKRAKITPNQLTVISFLFGVFAALLFALGQQRSLIYAIVGYQICIVLDYADGTLARLKQLDSFLGVWLEAALDPLREFFIIFGICFGLYSQAGNATIWILGFILCGTNFIMDIEAITYESFSFADENNSRVASKSRLFAIAQHFISIRTTRYILIIPFAIAGKMFLFLVFFSIYNMALLSLLTFSMGRTFRNEDNKKRSMNTMRKETL